MKHIHKILILVIGMILISACSESQVEEMAFKWTIEQGLIERCEEN